MKIRKNIIGFAIAAILLSLIGPWKVFAMQYFSAYNETSTNIRFVIVDSTNQTYWLDVNSHNDRWVQMSGDVKTLNFYSSGKDSSWEGLELSYNC